MGRLVLLGLLAAASLARGGDVTPPQTELITAGGGWPGDQVTGYRYVDPNAAGDQRSTFSFRAGRSRPLFDSDGYQRGWTADWTSAPGEHGGLLFSYRGSELDPRLVGLDGLGLDARWLGSRRQDFSAGWRQGGYAAEYIRQQLSAVNGAGLTREAVRLGGWGLEYRQDTVRVAPGAAFGDPLQQALLSAEGYGLSSRRLGQAAGGYTGLGALAGASDVFRQLRYSGDAWRAGLHERTIAADGANLLDRGAEVGWAGLALRYLQRAADAQFTLFKPVGYGPWARLRDAREEQLAAALETGPVSGSYSLTRTVGGLSGPRDSRGRTDIYQGSVTVRPLAGWSVSYGRTDRLSGALGGWEADDRALAAYAENTWKLERSGPASAWSLSARRYADRGQSAWGGEWGASYRFGDLLSAAYLEANSRTGTQDASHVRQRRLTFESGLGLSGLTEFAVRDRSGTSHHQLRLERAVGSRWQVGLGWENWRGTADLDYAIGGLSELIDGSSDASAYDASLTVRPGTAEIGLWQRWLLRDPAGAGDELPTGVGETGVTVRQQLLPMIAVGAGWRRYAWDSREREQRREVALELSDQDLPILPSARFGYRERRTADGAIEGTWFGSAEIRPYQGFSLLAAYASPTSPGELLTADPAATRRALTLTARQELASQGGFSASYSANPSDSAASRAVDADLALARELSFEMTVPRRWLNPALTLSGEYRLRSEAGVDLGGIGSQHEQIASLQWAPDELHSLSLRYRLGATRGESWWDKAQQRLELGYRGRLLGPGQLALQAWIQEQQQRFLEDQERFRIGVQYDLSF